MVAPTTKSTSGADGSGGFLLAVLVSSQWLLVGVGNLLIISMGEYYMLEYTKACTWSIAC
jgi:hypothetical protein